MDTSHDPSGQTTTITPAQYAFLTESIAPGRIRHLMGMAHLEVWDVRRHLIRAFGFGGFDIETRTLDLIREVEHDPETVVYATGGTNRHTVWTAIYRADVRLIIKVGGQEITHFDDSAVGESRHQPSLGVAHDMAVKTALSQALKRCAVNLGDQFGLSLYNNGCPHAVVIRSLVVPDGFATATPPTDDIPVQGEPTPHPDHDHDHNHDHDLGEDVTTGHGPVSEDISQDPDDHPTTAAEPMVTQSQHRHMHALWAKLGYGGRENRNNRITITSSIIKRHIMSSMDLTALEAEQIIAALKARETTLTHQEAA